MTTAQLPCPTCGRLSPVSNAKHLPFCSERCRLIDLGRWLDEEHAVPASKADEDENESASELSRSAPIGEPSEQTRKPVRLPPGWHDA